mgnify:CR=1 FL=1
MFHEEFYPTPPEVIQLMQLDCKGKVILEPHAGKGNIVDFCIQNGAKEVLSIEINKDLQHIVKQKSSLIGEDFFMCKPEQISHINAIYMNPPFSNADKHILHAWEIAPDGCEIISLCNFYTIERSVGRLKVLLRDYGITEYLGDCFTEAERKTGVDVGLIKLYKPNSKDNFEFEGFFMDEEEEEQQGIGIMGYNEVRALVNRYVYSMKAFDVMNEHITNLNNTTKDIGLSVMTLQVGYNERITSKEEFSKVLQKQSWNHIFNKMNMEKYVTSGVMKDINKFVETQVKVPFTMKNIYKMLEIIVGTRQQTFNRALEEAIDKFTAHTHENRFGVEGWKTNSGYMLNKKFIVDGVMETQSYMGFKPRYDSHATRKIDDLVKVLCNITGNDYNTIGPIYHIGRPIKEGQSFDKIEPNTWYDWGFFEIKCFKKGTMHFKFKDLNDWYRLNKAYGELKGFTLSEQYKSK